MNSSVRMPNWYHTYLNLKAAFAAIPQRPMEELKEGCEILIREVELDPLLDQRMKRKLQTNYAIACASSSSSLKRRALRSFIEDVPPQSQGCDLCGKHRLVINKLQVWEAFQCGSGLAFYPERGCSSAPDAIDEWLPFRKESASIPLIGANHDLDILAMAAETMRNEELKEKKLTKFARSLKIRQTDSPRGKRSRRKRLDFPQIKAEPSQSPDWELHDKEAIAGHCNIGRPDEDPENSSDARMQESSYAQYEPARASQISTSLDQLSPVTPSKESRRSESAATPSSIDGARAQSRGLGGLIVAESLQQQLNISNMLHRQETGIAGNGLGLSNASLLTRMPEKSSLTLLGRAVSDPHVLQRELARGIPPLEEEEPLRYATAASVLRSGVENSAYTPGRPLSRAISDPRKMQQYYGLASPIEALHFDLGTTLPARETLVEWQAVARFQNPLQPTDLFSLVAALPKPVADSFPTTVLLDGVRPREAIRMDSVIGKPLLLRLGQMTAAQMEAVVQMERSKIAVIANLKTFDLVLVPHTNSRDCLHFIGLRMERGGNYSSQAIPLARTVSALPALGIETVTALDKKPTFKARISKLKRMSRNLDPIPEDHV